jgi:NitT/TauT family transport system ATP-binding protein
MPAVRAGSIEVEDLNVIFSQARGTRAVQALKDISLSIQPGEFVSLVGPSGCGKSTMLKVLAGLITPTRGRVWASGTPVNGPRRSIGLMFQSPQLFPWRNVLGNVLLPIDVFGRRRKDYEDRARELLGTVGLDGLAQAYPKELSGGMQQRVALCRVLLADPEIILMDEPFGAVDEFTRERLDAEVLSIWTRSKKTIVFVTHNIAEAAFLADRVVVMGVKPGRIVDERSSPLPRPRTLDDTSAPEFVSLVHGIRRELDRPAPSTVDHA